MSNDKKLPEFPLDVLSLKRSSDGRLIQTETNTEFDPTQYDIPTQLNQPAPDRQGYVHAANLIEDPLVFGDVAAAFAREPLPVEVDVEDEISTEPELKLWRSRQTVRELTIPDAGEVSLETYLEENREDIETIIPYELLPNIEEEIEGAAAGELDSEYRPLELGLTKVGNPAEVISKLEKVGCKCSPYNAIQLSLILSVPTALVRSLLFEGQPGCGKSFTAKCLAKITGAEFMCLTCYPGMDLQGLIEKPSNIAIANAMAGKSNNNDEIITYGIITRAFLKSQKGPVVLLVDEIDKVDESIDSFFLAPLNDGVIYLETREPVEANLDNLLVVFTKNYNRTLDDAFMRRVTPVHMRYLDNDLEKRILKPHVIPQIVNNLVYMCDRMRKADGAYQFERPPAPDELLRAGRYTGKMIEWGITSFEVFGRSLFPIMAKSERDRIVFDQFLRFHPEFTDSLIPDPRKATVAQIHSKLGRIVTKGVIEDPDAENRKKAFAVEKVGWHHIGLPKEIAEKLEKVGYECPDYLAKQVGLLLNVKRDMVKTFVLEGPPGCGKSFLAKSLAKITGAEYMSIQCYKNMDSGLLIEYRNEVAIAQANAGVKIRKSDIMELGVLSRAFLKSQSQPILLLVDEIDKVDAYIDTFFLGPIQDGRIWLQSGPAIDANLDNLVVVFTKNYERPLNDALLRRVHPLTMTYLDASLERKILTPHCIPRLINNLVAIADVMRYSQGSFQFDRPPAPEELLTTARYVLKLLEWGYDSPEDIGFQVWRMVAKSERDRSVLEHLFRYHPDFDDPRDGDPQHVPIAKIYARLGKKLLKGILREDDVNAFDAGSESDYFN
jgi:MoxR-like ATPase